MKNKIFFFLIGLFIGATTISLSAKSPTLYVVTRSTKVFHLTKEDNPTVGLFATDDQGKTWRHYGWKYVKCFSVSITEKNNELVYYLSCGNGVHKSSDSGKTWRITTGWDITECLKTAIDPVEPDVVYSATAYGIYKTTDGGNTWIEKNRGLTSTFTPAVIIDSADHNHIICATEAGIHHSRDGAENWQPLALLGLGIRTLIQHPKNSDWLACGTENDGVFISRDHGKTWQQVNEGLTHKTIYALAFDPKNPKILYAGTFQGGIFKTTDAGKHWKPMNKNLRLFDIHALAVDPANSDIVYAGTLNDGIWMSKNGGKSWQFIGLETSQVWDIVFF